jgi:putative spermidine/putrescine transport system permease protein
MTLSKFTKGLLASIMGVGLAFIYVPLIIVVINSFNPSKTFSWPPKEFTTVWWGKAI